MNNMNPWKEFQIWLTSNNNLELSPEIYKIVNSRNALLMFCYLDDVTIYLNNKFNKFEIMKFTQRELFSFLKHICITKNIGIKKLSFIKHHKKDKIISEIQTKLPYLKKEEVKLFLEKIKGTNDEEEILESLNLKKIEKKRLTKKQIKEINENLIKNKEDITTWDEWIKHFN